MSGQGQKIITPEQFQQLAQQGAFQQPDPPKPPTAQELYTHNLLNLAAPILAELAQRGLKAGLAARLAVDMAKALLITLKAEEKLGVPKELL